MGTKNGAGGRTLVFASQKLDFSASLEKRKINFSFSLVSLKRRTYGSRLAPEIIEIK